MKRNFTNRILTMLICLMIIYTLAFPHEIAYHTRKALDLCYSAVIPSLFFFIVLSKILSHYITKNGKSHSLGRILSRIFNIPSPLIPSCLLGLFCGAPSMSYSIKNIYQNGLCTKKEVQRAMILSNNCSFSFIFGFASATFTDGKMPFIIILSNLLSTFTVYFLLFRGKRENTYRHFTEKPLEDRKFSNVITESISDSVFAVITLCGFIVLFYTLSFTVKRHLLYFLSLQGAGTDTCNGISAVICSVFEMTAGTVSAFAVDGYARIPLLCFCTSLLGISVFFQVTNVFSGTGISVTPFIVSKILSAFLSSAISVIILFFIPADIPANSSFGGNKMGGFSFYHLICIISVTALCFIGASVISHIDKRHKN